MPKLCVMTTSTIPTHKLSDCQQRTIEARKKYPRDGEGGTILTYVAKRSDEGIKTVFIVQPSEGKLEAEYRLQTDRQMMYNDIEGYESAVEVWANHMSD
jgi:hypothetical protein